MAGRVRQLKNGRWEVEWRAARRFATLPEALDAAKQPLPPPPQQGRYAVPFGMRRMFLKLADAGISPGLIARGMTWAGVPTPTGGSTWAASTVRNAIKRAREERAEADERARASEWQVFHAPAPPGD